jgi:hypothetical protein
MGVAAGIGTDRPVSHGVGVVPAAILLAAALWDTRRLLALGPLAGFFLAAVFDLRKARTKPRLFAVGRTPYSSSSCRRFRQLPACHSGGKVFPPCA